MFIDKTLLFKKISIVESALHVKKKYRKSWRREYFDCHDHNQQLLSIPLAWTDAAAPNPFIVLAAGRAYFQFEDLLALAELIDRLNG